jgi:hypothetical protein
MAAELIKSRSQSMVGVPEPKPRKRDRNGTTNIYNTLVHFGNWEGKSG